jgi:hypothetical protein
MVEGLGVESGIPTSTTVCMGQYPALRVREKRHIQVVAITAFFACTGHLRGLECSRASPATPFAGITRGFFGSVCS